MRCIMISWPDCHDKRKTDQVLKSQEISKRKLTRIGQTSRKQNSIEKEALDWNKRR